MRLASIHTYPVKSCHRIDHGGAPVAVEPWGLAGDRRWLVIDTDGRCVTQREAAAMATVHPASQPDGGLELTAPAAPPLRVSPPAAGELLKADVHGTVVPATPVAAAADDWFTTVLGRTVRLVWLDDPTRRGVDPDFGRPSDRVSFADAYPLLLTNTASLAGLNDWLLEAGADEGPLPMTRFRPNVVVEGAPAWAEDGWIGRRLRIGEVSFRAVKPCDRCVVTTTDQETGVRGKEPLRILAGHRKFGQKLLFGVNLIPDPPYGKLTAGEPVEVLDPFTG